MKRILTGTLVGGIAMLAAGYVIWDVLFLDFYQANPGAAENLWRDAPVWWAVALGTLTLAALVTAVIEKCDDLNVVSGFKWGGLMGFMIWLGVNMILHGYSNFNSLTIALVDPLLEFVRTGIGGAAIAAVLARTAGTTSSVH
ncbi:MAG: hypothetical protein E4H28_02885 [Gemmatimonadales bacterium]|nr:MAG: hypothetical protein E4H28_02885 [Gemmatimonadales bacterium]